MDTSQRQEIIRAGRAIIYGVALGCIIWAAILIIYFGCMHLPLPEEQPSQAQAPVWMEKYDMAAAQHKAEREAR